MTTKEDKENSEVFKLRREMLKKGERPQVLRKDLERKACPQDTHS